MNLTVPLQNSTEIKKKLFKLKPLRRDGLLLNIHYSKENAKIRFLYCCFHESSHVLALADNEGHIYIVDFFTCKFWGLLNLDSCTIMKFSSFNPGDLLAGIHSGDICVINFDSGEITGKLEGHKLPVNAITFAQKVYCLSASQYEAIIWDLQINTKLQVLALDTNTAMKFVSFMPVSNNILVCFKDDLIQVWNSDKFESIKQFLPTDWNQFSVKTIAFSRNGQVMVIAGYLPMLAIFLLDKWKLTKLVSLPEYILTIKSVEFVIQPFDGGCNKILAILSGQGILHFYDIEQNIILSELTPNCQIKRIECCPNGTYIACVLSNGEIELYNLNQYIIPPTDVKVEKVRKVSSKIKPRECKEKIGVIKNEINDMLEIEKLKAILKEFGEYPEAHRLKIWEKLLHLPNNLEQYNSIISHTTVVAFRDLYSQYPLESRTSIKCLKKLLNNIVTWCPFFTQVEYLPIFAFPFVKVFHNKPVACFEAICTIILNWCQHWFEYYPLAPVNVLAMIENLLMEHDPELLHHFSTYNITSNLYAWPLLETVFSEVLTAKEWLLFWDHVLTNEPAFLICAVVSYNMLHRDTLLSLKSVPNIDFFFHNQNPNNTKKFIQKTYCILKNTSEKTHPRQYLEYFKSIEVGNYPLFVGYPRQTVDLQMEHLKMLDSELVNIETYEADLLEQAKRKWEACECEKNLEEKRRQNEMKQVYIDKIKAESEKVSSKREQLEHLRKLLGEEETKIFSDALKKSPKGDYIMTSPCDHCWMDSQNGCIRKYAKLLRDKYEIEGFVDKDDLSLKGSDIERLRKHKHKLDEEIDKVKKSLISPDKLKELNLATNIIAVEEMIKNVERQLQLDSDPLANLNNVSKVELLQKETQELEKGVTSLLNMLHKSTITKSRKSDKHERVSRRSDMNVESSRRSEKKAGSLDHRDKKSSSEEHTKTVRFSKAH